MVEILERAVLDTIIGMGVVFVMLILIAFIIWCFKFIYEFEQKKANNAKQSEAVTISTPIAETSIIEEEEELVDDLELVAVITAAIYASMGDSVPVNGLVVKSIKKANKAAWLRA